MTDFFLRSLTYNLHQPLGPVTCASHNSGITNHHVVYLCKYLFVGAVALDELVLADATAQADYVGNLGNYCVGEINRFSITLTVSHIYTLHSYI